MSRWWRAYDGCIDDPKLRMLSDETFRAWFHICCIASANGGVLPEIEVVAFKLRCSTEKAISYIRELLDKKLIDEEENCQKMHDWDRWQYKSDVSTERVKRFRKRRETVSETPPEYRVQNKKDAANAAPSVDPERDLFRRGKEVAGEDAGGLIAKLLKAKKGNVSLARAAVEMAATKQKPREYLGAVIVGGHASADGKRLSNDEQFFGVGRIPGVL
jgi:hypothetical protein